MPDPSQLQPEVQVSLVDAWRILVRRRFLVLATWLACILAGLALASMQSPTYQTSAKLRIGQVAGAGPIEDANEFAARLLAGDGRRDTGAPTSARLVSARASAGSPNIVDVIVEARSADAAAALISQIVDAAVADHGRRFAGMVAPLEAALESLRAQRAGLVEAATAGEAKPAAGQDPVQGWIRLTERSRAAELMFALDKEIPDIAIRLAPPKTQPTVVLGSGASPPARSSPRPLLLVLFAAAIGLVLGSLAALSVELIARGARGS
jgi:hypothetical protein